MPAWVAWSFAAELACVAGLLVEDGRGRPRLALAWGAVAVVVELGRAVWW